jgi:hypothetical protein
VFWKSVDRARDDRGPGPDAAEGLPAEGDGSDGVAALKRCPRCAEEIRAEATRCRYCQADVRTQSQGEFITTWVRGHSTLALSLVTFLFVVFQIYKAAGFEVNSTVELLRAGGLSTIVVGVLLVLLPIEMVLMSLAGSWWILAAAESVQGDAAGTRRRLDLDPRTAPALVLAALALLGFWTSPWPLWLLCLVVSGTAVWLAVRRAGAGTIGARRLRRVIVALAVGFGFLLLQRPTIWVPAEKLSLRDGDPVVAYVIDYEGGWATLLTPDHRLLRISTTRVADRELCAVEYLEARLFDRVLRLRPAQVIGAISSGSLPESLTPPCPKEQ